MEEGRRYRRFAVTRGKTLRQPRGLLPLLHSASSATESSNTISCWYCEFKFFAITEPIFHFGRRNVRYLRVWFSIGVGFGVALMVALSLFLLWELGGVLHGHSSYPQLSKLLFGFSPSISGLRISFADAGYLIFSTVLSVCVHEFGHAIAAASEGIQMEYLAVFMAVLFPGALVAFNYEELRSIPHISALRIYCAGVWHNAVTCALCGLTLLILPSFFFPLYTHGHGLMVLEVPYSSPLYGYLSTFDVIVSFDGMPIHDEQDWSKAIAVLDELSNQGSNDSLYSGNLRNRDARKGYCVPRVLIKDSENTQFVDDLTACPNDLTSFMSIPCSDWDVLEYNHSAWGHAEIREHSNCLDAKEIIKLNKCGDGWFHDGLNGNRCTCTEDESCLTPMQPQGSTWVELTYISHYSPECLEAQEPRNSVLSTSNYVEKSCSGTFVYVGDPLSLTSVELTAYQPRWAFGAGAYIPNVLEKILNCAYHVSLTLALLNSLPVFFLDGESILEVNLRYCSYLSPSKRKRIQQVILVAGTSLTLLAFVRMVAKDAIAKEEQKMSLRTVSRTLTLCTDSIADWFLQDDNNFNFNNSRRRVSKPSTGNGPSVGIAIEEFELNFGLHVPTQ